MKFSQGKGEKSARKGGYEEKTLDICPEAITLALFKKLLMKPLTERGYKWRRIRLRLSRMKKKEDQNGESPLCANCNFK